MLKTRFSSPNKYVKVKNLLSCQNKVWVFKIGCYSPLQKVCLGESGCGVATAHMDMSCGPTSCDKSHMTHVRRSDIFKDFETTELSNEKHHNARSIRCFLVFFLMKLCCYPLNDCPNTIARSLSRDYLKDSASQHSAHKTTQHLHLPTPKPTSTPTPLVVYFSVC